MWRIGHALETAREAKSWSLIDLAARSGVSRQSIAKIEAGHPRGEIGIVADIADALGLQLTVQERRSDRMGLIEKIRGNTDRASREAVLARGIYGAQVPSQLPDGLVEARAAHLTRQYAELRANGGSILFSTIPSQIREVLDERDPAAPALLELCEYSTAYLRVRLEIEHPCWVRPIMGEDHTRGQLARVVAKYGTNPAPDERGRLIRPPRKLRSSPSSAGGWFTEAERALSALKPDAAQRIANAVSRELWGCWIVQDLRVYAFPHERRHSATQYFVANSEGGRGRYQGKPAYDAANSWPESEAAEATGRGRELSVRHALGDVIRQLADVYGKQWTDSMWTFGQSLDVLAMNATVAILSSEAAPETGDDYERALTALIRAGSPTDSSVRTAVIDAARRVSTPSPR